MRNLNQKELEFVINHEQSSHQFKDHNAQLNTIVSISVDSNCFLTVSLSNGDHFSFRTSQLEKDFQNHFGYALNTKNPGSAFGNEPDGPDDDGLDF